VAGRNSVSWAQVQDSDLFSWFNMSESEPTTSDGLTTVKVEPGAFQDFIGVWFTIDSGGEVVGFRLVFDRAWLDDTPTGMSSGADLAASIFRTVAAADPILAEVAEALMAGGIAASRPPVLVGPGWPPAPVEDAEVASLVKVFIDMSAPPTAVNGHRLLRAANVQDGPSTWFNADWH
jgi:hypothetical protein